MQMCSLFHIVNKEVREWQELKSLKMVELEMWV